MTAPENEADAWSEVAGSGSLVTAILDALSEPVFIKDRQLRWVAVNRAFEGLVGLKRDEILGRTDRDLFGPESAGLSIQRDHQVLTSGVSLATDDDPFPDAGGAVRLLPLCRVPVCDARGEPSYLVGVIRDQAGPGPDAAVDEQLEARVRAHTAELKLAQQALLRKERFAVLGQLAGGLAHELRNPLASIANAVAVLERRLAPIEDPDLGTALAIVREEVWNANRIISDLLDYARIRPPERRPVRLRQIVEEVLELQSIPSGIEVRYDIPEELELEVDQRQIRDALGNLVRNALEAMPTGGTLSLSARSRDGLVTMEVADTGQGVPETVEPLLFEPLVTSKPMGLGLGLATARALVENHGGSLRCARGRSPGAHFEMVLPERAPAEPRED